MTLIAASIDQVIWLMEWPSLKAIYLSPAFEQIWGLRIAEVRDNPTAWLDVMLDVDREQLLERAKEFISGERFEFEFRITASDGSVRWLRSEGIPTAHAAGIPTRVAGTTSDITALRATRAALTARETMHAQWMASARDFVVYRLRATGGAMFHADVEFVSPSIEYVMGVAVDAPFDQWFANIHPQDLKRVTRASQRAAADGTDFDEVMRIWHPHREQWRTLRAISTSGRDADDDTVTANGLIVDITERMLAEAENRLRSDALAHSLNAFYIADQDRKLIDANQAFLDMWGYAGVSDARGRAIEEFFADTTLIDSILECLDARGFDRREATARRSDGTHFEIMMASRRFTDADGREVILGTAIDITNQKRATTELQRAAMVFENTSEGVMITDAEAKIVAVNQAFCAMSGFDEAEVIGQNPNVLRSDRHDAAFFSQMWAQLGRSGQWRGEVWNRRKDGERLPVRLTINRVDDAASSKPTGYVALMADVSGVKRAEEQLYHMAHHDALTQLPNRLLLDARLEHALQRARRDRSRVAVMFLDVDRFKNVNDSLGHPAGDKLLSEVARRLRENLREEDTVARVGGDEFALVLEGVRDRKDVSRAADKLIAALSGTIELAGGSAALTTSIGVVLYPDHGDDATTLLKHADAAMYRAKERGRNQYQFYSDELTTAAHDRLSLEVDMRRALERGDEFTLHFQPLVELASGAIFGVEALMRWQHPTRGAVSPTEFIPIAEDCGLIEALGEWALHSACRELQRWHASGLPGLQMSVNVSARQLVRRRVVESLRNVLRDYELPPNTLALELTETVLMNDPVSAGRTLRELAALGVGLSVDDFGTGYSSLSYLKRFPVNTLKIDRSFVRDAPRNSGDAAICRAVIALAKSLGLKVIAEGVETAAHRDLLLAAGCVFAQGYLYSRPLPAADLNSILRRNYTDSVLAPAQGARAIVNGAAKARK